MGFAQRSRLVLCGVLVVLVATIAGTVAGQSGAAQIMFGVIPLTLGMQEKMVLDELRGKYRVVSTSPDNWAVIENDPSLPAIGSIAFQAGRLSYVRRTWVQLSASATGESDAVGLARVFHGVISQFVKEQRRSCTIGTYDSFTPQAEGLTTYIACGGKEVQVVLLRTDRLGWTATIDEVMPAVP